MLKPDDLIEVLYIVVKQLRDDLENSRLQLQRKTNEVETLQQALAKAISMMTPHDQNVE